MVGMDKICMGMALVAGLAAAAPNNTYVAGHTSTPPVIDGLADAIWDKAAWDSINVNWIGPKPTATDFAGRYKVLWDSARVYLLVEIQDDSLSDVYPDPLDHYWDDDAVEIFLDENHDGGDHQNNFSAWAYHIGTKFDAVDYGTDGQPHLFNDHFQVKRTSVGHKYLWELSMSVYGADYKMGGANHPLRLASGKTMGFSIAYCDNDGGSSRKHFVGSVNTPGHLANQGYLNADCFGTLILNADSTSNLKRSRGPARASILQCRPDAFRWRETSMPEVRRPDGRAVSVRPAGPDGWMGQELASGGYLVSSSVGGDPGIFRKLR